jgi:hypothetical protein
MEKLLSAGHVEHKYAVRMRTVMLREQGEGTSEIAKFLGIHQNTISAYIKRYNAYGIDALLRDSTIVLPTHKSSFWEILIFFPIHFDWSLYAASSGGKDCMLILY